MANCFGVAGTGTAMEADVVHPTTITEPFPAGIAIRGKERLSHSLATYASPAENLPHQPEN